MEEDIANQIHELEQEERRWKSILWSMYSEAPDRQHAEKQRLRIQKRIELLSDRLSEMEGGERTTWRY